MAVFQSGSDYSLVSAPAAATQATATRAAGTNGTRHVVDSISATIATGATAVTVPLYLNIRDGASGAGTVLYSVGVILPANAVWTLAIPLRVLGSPATALTAEFSAAPPAGAFQSLSVTGHDEN